MQTASTVQDWDAVIGDLSARRDTARQEATRLRQDSSPLVLEAAMGGQDAKKKLDRNRAEVSRLNAEIDDYEIALSAVRVQRRQAEEAEAAEADRNRREAIIMNLKRYLTEIGAVDDAMRLLVARFAAAKETRARAEALMTDEERRGLGYFEPEVSATLAAAGFGLRDYIQIDGRFISRHSPSDRIPLAAAAARAVSGWVERGI